MTAAKRLRVASPNERRYIVRQALDYYRNLIIAGIYSLDIACSEEELQAVLIKALKHCCSVHPLLSATIAGGETNAPAWTRPEKLNLLDHIELLAVRDLVGVGEVSREEDLIKAAFRRTHDRPLTSHDQTPPWKIVVLPLADRKDSGEKRFLIMFAYYHSHGDGKSGLAFHKAFLEGLRLAASPECPYTANAEHDTPDVPFLPAFEQAGRLTISWSYLLSPLLGAYLPSFIASPLNIRASATPEAHDQWRALKTAHDPANHHTELEMLVVDNSRLQKTLAACRTHQTTLTGLLHQLIIRALSEAVPGSETAGSFVSQTAVDLRAHLSGITSDDMALCPTAYYELFPRSEPEAWASWTDASSSGSSPVWAAARATTQGLVERASSLHNQPIGLLAYLSDFHAWMRGQIGKPRDASYELSNILVFNPGEPEGEQHWVVETMLFSQPANAGGGAVTFNTVSRAGGDLVLIMSWQAGVLGLDDEREFGARVCGSIGASFDELARA